MIDTRFQVVNVFDCRQFSCRATDVLLKEEVGVDAKIDLCNVTVRDVKKC